MPRPNIPSHILPRESKLMQFTILSGNSRFTLPHSAASGAAWFRAAVYRPWSVPIYTVSSCMVSVHTFPDTPLTVCHAPELLSYTSTPFSCVPTHIRWLRESEAMLLMNDEVPRSASGSIISLILFPLESSSMIPRSEPTHTLPAASALTAHAGLGCPFSFRNFMGEISGGIWLMKSMPVRYLPSHTLPYESSNMLHINEVDDPSDTSASGNDTNDTEAMSVKALLRMSRMLTP